MLQDKITERMHVYRKNHPHQKGIVGSIRGNWALVWWEIDIVTYDNLPPHLIRLSDLEPVVYF